MKQYLDLLREVHEKGNARPDRTGTGTVSVFGRQLRFDLQKGFPLLTTKRVPMKSVIGELLWFLSGSTNIKNLHKDGITIWDEWATEEGNLGPIYGAQWRDWLSSEEEYGNVDQIADLIENIKKDPYSRRHVVTAWNPAELPLPGLSPQENVRHGRMALAPCHCLFQFYVEDGRLSCQLYQRSADLFLGVPFNIASYALLTHMVAQQCDLEVGEFIHTFGDCHLYQNHRTKDIVEEQLKREPYASPQLVIKRKPPTIFDYQIDDFELVNYFPLPAIKAPISV